MSRAVRWQYLPGEEGSGCENGPPPVGPPTGCIVTNCTAYAAMEYRYQGGRARYMVRPRNPETMQLYPYAANDGQWFDYDGEEIYGDFGVAYDGQTVTVTDVIAHEPGLAQYDDASGELHHLHGNLIGTTERMTDAAGSIAHRAVYTAFGELIEESGTVSTRYGYAGAYGYQSARSEPPADPLAELGWLHVGHRYYDPSTGRFVQRDPIGIWGGANTYVYMANNPLSGVDPTGLSDDDDGSLIKLLRELRDWAAGCSGFTALLAHLAGMTAVESAATWIGGIAATWWAFDKNFDYQYANIRRGYVLDPRSGKYYPLAKPLRPKPPAPPAPPPRLPRPYRPMTHYDRVMPRFQWD